MTLPSRAVTRDIMLRALALSIGQLGDPAILRVLAKSLGVTLALFVALGFGVFALLRHWLAGFAGGYDDGLAGVAAVAIFVPQPILWSIPSSFLSGASAAAGLAVINSVGNLGGFIAQNVIPWIWDVSGSNTVPMLFLAACLALGGLMTFVLQAVIRHHPSAKAVTADALTRPAE